MKTYKSSDLTNAKRAEAFEEAESNGIIIEQRKTNGKVINKLVLINYAEYEAMKSKSK